MNWIFQKDESSKFSFLSVGEFLLVIFLMIAVSAGLFLYFPFVLQKFLFGYKEFLKSYYFGIVLSFISSVLNIGIIYFFVCKRKNKTIREGFFLNSLSSKILLISVLSGIVMPLISLPVIFKFAPSEFYAMDMAKTKSGLIYLFTMALLAPVFEEIFYRGFFFPFFQSRLNSFWAVIITALFFGLSHYMNIGNAHILLSLFIFYGFVLTLLRYYSNSLLSPMLAHFLHNLTLIVSFFFASKG